jgi:hypothetical protein
LGIKDFSRKGAMAQRNWRKANPIETGSSGRSQLSVNSLLPLFPPVQKRKFEGEVTLYQYHPSFAP